MEERSGFSQFFNVLLLLNLFNISDWHFLEGASDQRFSMSICKAET